MDIQKIKVAIIDDEMHCIKTLRYLLEKDFKDLELVYVSTDCSASVRSLQDAGPDLLFLDIEMPGMNGLQFLEQFDDIPFKVIFTTAYDQYAIRAIKLSALDYILKPVTRASLGEAIEKFRKDREKSARERAHAMHYVPERRMKNVVAFSSTQGLQFVKTNDILYLEAENCYTRVIMQDGTSYLVSKTLANFEEILTEDFQFFRAHKSYIINLGYIKSYIRGDGGEIIMRDNKSVALSRQKKDDFLKMFIKL